MYWRNWYRNQSCAPLRRFVPRAVDEVVELVERARSERRTLRVVGAGHSWSDVACSDGYLLSLDRMARVLSVDPATRRVTVEAGIRLHDLYDALDRHGLSLGTMGAIDRQSLAGALATGTHGTGMAYGNLSSLVVGMELVTGTGELLRLTEGDELLDAMRVGLGACGIVVALTLQCEEAFNLRSVERQVETDRAMERLDRYIEANDYFQIWHVNHTGTSYLFEINRTADPPPRPLLRGLAPLTKALGAAAERLFLGACNLWPRATPALFRLALRTALAAKTRHGSSRQILVHGTLNRYIEHESSIPIAAAAAAVAELRGMRAERELMINGPIGLRFVKGDAGWLSPAYERDSCFLSVTTASRRRELVRAYFGAVERILKRYGGRPHWGKIFRQTGLELRQLYPRWDDFLEVRRQLDPRGVFDNRFLNRLFG